MNRWMKGFLAFGLLLSLLAAGCQRQQAKPAPQVPEVAVVTVQPRSVMLRTELRGRTASYVFAEIRPQVNGLLQKRFFEEGADVKKDDLLYQIDPAPFEAARDNALANVAAAKKDADRAEAALGASVATLKRHQAMLALNRTNLHRYDVLVKTQAVSAMVRDQAATDVDVAEATLKAAEAQVESDRQSVGAAQAAIKQAEAALETARINLGYTKISAPISGRIGRSHMTEGAIVTAYQIAPLAVIHQFDPIYVDVPWSTLEVNRLKRSVANGRLKGNGTDRVKIELQDGTPYPQEGSLKFRDVTVDPTTGSVILRIVVPNPDRTLLPNMFVSATIDEGLNENAILVPQQAVSRDPKGNPLALTVSKEGKVEQRSLVTDRAMGDEWLIASGLSAGDRVIVEGMQRVRPGAGVKAVPFSAGRTAAKPESTAQATKQPR